MIHLSKNKLSNKNGALLLEILLSVTIMSISLGVIIQSMTISMRSARYAAQYTQAVIAADAAMTSQIKELRFQDAANPDDLGEGEEVSRYLFSVESEPSVNSSDIEIVRLVTEWKTGTKNNKLELSTYSRMGP